MSRRTKLIILAIFMVLLALPAAYVAYTWHPAEPLQFHVEQVTPPPEYEDFQGFLVLHVRIKNSNPVPIHFCQAAVIAPPELVISRETLPGEIFPEDVSKGLWLRSIPQVMIPAHGEVRVSGTVSPEYRDLVKGGDMLVEYYWRSLAEDWWYNAWSWMSQHAPPWTHDLVPRPSERRETTTLEYKEVPPPPPSPAPAR